MTSSRKHLTTFTVLLRESDDWTTRDPEVLFSYSFPTGADDVNPRFVAELRAFADKMENRWEFHRIERGLEADGFEQ